MAQANIATIDSNTLATQIERQNSNIEDAAAAITAANQEIQSLGNIRAQATIDAASAEATVKTAAATGTMRAQQAALKAATVIGTNLDDASELITSLGMKAREDFALAEKAREAYFASKNISFFDNPLEYISNELLGGSTKLANEYNKYAMNYNATTSRLDEIAEQTTAHATAQAAIAQTITAGSIEALQTQLATKALGDATQIKQQNLLYNINGIEAVMKMNSQQLDNYFKLNSAVMSEKHLAIAQASFAMQQKSHALALEERTDRINQKKADREEIETLGATINAGRASMGLPDIPVGRAVQMMKMGGEAGEAIKHQYTVGATQVTTGKPVIADNPGRAARVISSTQAPLSPAAKPIKDLLLGALSDTISNNKKIDKKDLNQVDKATTELAKQTATVMASNIKSEDGANIYQAPDLGTLARIPAIAESALFKKIIAPAVEAGVTRTDPGIIVNQTINAIQTRQVSFEEAVEGLNKIFKGAVAVNNENKDFLRYGIAPQVGYTTTIAGAPSSTFKSYTPIDLTNTTAVSNLLSKRLSEGLRFNVRTGKFDKLP